MTTTAAAPPPGKVVCPRCNGSMAITYYKGPGATNLAFRDCDDCEGNGFITDPRINAWNGSDPAAMIKLLGDGADRDARLRMWVQACRDACGPNVLWQEPRFNDHELWATREVYYAPPMATRAALLRCLIVPPYLVRERVTCPECDGSCEVEIETMLPSVDSEQIFIEPCQTCQGSGTIPGPLLDPICRTSTVMGLAAVIRGGMFCGECGTRYKETTLAHKSNCRCLASTMIHQPPHFDRLPVLGDALEDAGADPELVHHCRAGGPHVAACWSLEAVLGSN